MHLSFFLFLKTKQSELIHCKYCNRNYLHVHIVVIILQIYLRMTMGSFLLSRPAVHNILLPQTPNAQNIIPVCFLNL